MNTSARRGEAIRLFNSKFSHLQGHKFWFFFYGYDVLKVISFSDNKWPLVKLVLEFPETKGNNLIVKITNTDDSEHYHYVGMTDFSTSAENVLVINCRTTGSLTRQLNIKLHIGSGRGSIFLGQYLNYEESGRIISGNVIVKRIPEGVDATPIVHRVPKLAADEKIYTDDFEGIDWGILQYLNDKRINFRRNPLRAGHELSSLRAWLISPRNTGGGSPLFGEDDTIPNSRFTASEIRQLRERVEDIEKQIADLNLPAEAKEAINEVVRDVPEKAKRLTKKEISEVITGAIIKQGMQWGLTVDHAQAVWDACQHFFTVLF